MSIAVSTASPEPHNSRVDSGTLVTDLHAEFEDLSGSLKLASKNVESALDPSRALFLFNLLYSLKHLFT